jgi:hypothetical protein
VVELVEEVEGGGLRELEAAEQVAELAEAST